MTQVDWLASDMVLSRLNAKHVLRFMILYSGVPHRVVSRFCVNGYKNRDLFTRLNTDSKLAKRCVDIRQHSANIKRRRGVAPAGNSLLKATCNIDHRMMPDVNTFKPGWHTGHSTQGKS